jgi:hypothetical protein
MGLLRAEPMSLWVVETSVAVSSDPEAEVLALLTTGDWREVIVGAVAMLAGAASGRVLEAAWPLLDRHAFAAPEIASALVLVDATFEAQAGARLRDALARDAWTKSTACLAEVYRRCTRVDRGLLDELEVRERDGRLDSGGLAQTRRWLQRAAANATPGMRARWIRAPL